MSYKPTWKERVEDAQRYKGPAIAALIALGVSGWVAWRLTHPRSVPEVPALTANTVAVEPTEASKEPGAEALHVQFEIARSLATAAAARGSWADATKSYAEARAALAEINDKFPKSQRADPVGLERLDADIAAAAASQLAADSAARERTADLAAIAGRAQEAASVYVQASDLQRELNEKFGSSPHAGNARLEALAAKRDTTLSTQIAVDVVALDREIAGRLRARDTRMAAEKIAAAAALVVRVDRNFPRSAALAVPLRRKIEFLVQWREQLQAMQSQIHGQLVPLPGAPKVRILKTEVSQELFSRVLNINPSRNSGRLLPADSVSWQEAQEFCARLSWLLGGRVRLPTEMEFRAAAIAGEGGVWSLENANSRTREIGTSTAATTGLHDIGGNVAEWLQPVAYGGDTATIAGGSYLDGITAIRSMPVVSVDKRERARHIGFRFVVELEAD